MASCAPLVSFPVRLARGVLPAVTVAAALLVVAPGLGAPFSTPKRWVLIAAATAALALLPWSRRRLAGPLALLPVTAVLTLPFALGSAPEPTWTWLAFGLLAFAWASSGVDARGLVPAVVGSGALVAVIALAQDAGLDPFAALVPHADGERLRVYATLGNPDFVASALTVVLCLAAAWAVEATRRAPWLIGLALVLLGLAVTRSFATVASLGAALAASALHLARSTSRRAKAEATRVPAAPRARDAGGHDASADAAEGPASTERTPGAADDCATRHAPSPEEPGAAHDGQAPDRGPTPGQRFAASGREASHDAPPTSARRADVLPARPAPRRLLWLAMALLVALAVPLAGRSLSSAAAGRLYLARVIAPHALDAPLVGLGPGAVEALWPAWEVEWWRARCGSDAACVAADPRSRFAALQDHAHDDWLEVLVERGLVGLAALLALFAFALRRAWRSPRALGTGVVAALVAMMTRAALDFPLARPADLCLLAAVVGLASHLEEP